MYYVLAPVPNLRGRPALHGWRDGPRPSGTPTSSSPRWRRAATSDLGAGIEVSHVVTPADWAAAGTAAGTPFAAAHTFGQTGPFRPGNLHPALSNVVFVGSGTQPGVGVPMVLISGKLAAQRVTGHR